MLVSQSMARETMTIEREVEACAARDDPPADAVQSVYVRVLCILRYPEDTVIITLVEYTLVARCPCVL